MPSPFPADPEPSREPEPNRTRPQILVVADEENGIPMLLRTFLSIIADAEIHLVENLAELESALPRIKPDCVLLDDSRLASPPSLSMWDITGFPSLPATERVFALVGMPSGHELATLEQFGIRTLIKPLCLATLAREILGITPVAN